MKTIATIIATLSLAGAAQANTGGTPYCQDDMPCFNWRTMGNHQRAITTLRGRTLVVGVVRFDRLNASFKIDWSRSRKLRGDGERLHADYD